MKQVVSIGLCLAWALVGLAQSTTSLTGTVTDPTGAVIPNATITVENVETGLKRSSATDATGGYSFPQLPPGLYRVTAAAAGFRTTSIPDVRLLVNNPATLNIRMEVGQITETVAVTAEAVQVNTTDASIGNAIGTKPVVELPLNARNIISLLAAQPGVVFTREDDTDSRNGAVNGGKSDQANVTLDGVDVNDQMDRTRSRSSASPRSTPTPIRAALQGRKWRWSPRAAPTNCTDRSTITTATPSPRPTASSTISRAWTAPS
jgi:hypothetical protein